MPGRIVVCIPAFNEETTIAKVVLLSKRQTQDVIVFDDGSRDMTAELAKAAGARVLSGEKNMGKGYALRRLFEEAKSLGPGIVVSIDGDGQHDPSDIPKVVQPILDQTADVVIGVRPTKAGVMPTSRILGNKVLDAMVNMHAELDLHDTQSGFRAYSAKALDAISFKEVGMSVESQTLIDAMKANLKIAEVPIFTTYENVKQKRSPVSHFMEIVDYILTATVAKSPIKFLGLPGLISLILGVLLGLEVVTTFASSQQLAVGTALLSGVLMIMGTVAMATSVIVKLLRE